jgi:feruloyl esterase
MKAACISMKGRPAPACCIQGAIRSTIGFQAWPPMDRWTNRYLRIGCGGLRRRICISLFWTSGCKLCKRGDCAMVSAGDGHTDPSAAS